MIRAGRTSGAPPRRQTARGSFRYRPPQRRAAASPTPAGRQIDPGVRSFVNIKPTYLSREGEAALRAELEELVNVRRSEVAARIHDAKEHGDLSENAEYEEAKNEQAFVEGRIQTLEGMLKTAVIIENSGSEHVALGSVVDGRVATTARRRSRSSARPRPARPSGQDLQRVARRPRPAGQEGRRDGVVKLPNGTDYTYTIKSIS